MRRLVEQEFSPEVITRKFSYEPTSGIIYLAGTSTSIGSRTCCGYINVHVGNKRYVRAHRIAYCLMTGYWPKGEIDHINGRRDDNSWDNLRLVTTRQQTHNRRYQRNGRMVGCYFNTQHRKWHARINIEDGKKQIHIGSFNTEGEAHAAYAATLKEWTGEDVLE